MALTLAVLTPGTAHADPESPLTTLVDHAAERLQTADDVAATKYRSGGAIDDLAREQQVIDAVTADAADHRLDTAYVHDIFRDQIDATASVEHTRVGQWKIDPAAAPTNTTELASIRGTIDRLNGAIVDEIAAAWPALHAPACTADLRNALDSVSADRRLDDVYRRALGYATHRYCG
ncbi:chorismate mutase [Mycobacterium sp. NPDC003449]